MTGLSPGGGWAGHPDLVGRAAAVLKVTAVGRDPFWAATHGGSGTCVAFGSPRGEKKEETSSSCLWFYCTSLMLHFVCIP